VRLKPTTRPCSKNAMPFSSQQTGTADLQVSIVRQNKISSATSLTFFFIPFLKLHEFPVLDQFSISVPREVTSSSASCISVARGKLSARGNFSSIQRSVSVSSLSRSFIQYHLLYFLLHHPDKAALYIPGNDRLLVAP